MRVPSVSTRGRKLASTRAVTGPGLPVPMTRPSSLTTGMTSAPVPLLNTCDVKPLAPLSS